MRAVGERGVLAGRKFGAAYAVIAVDGCGRDDADLHVHRAGLELVGSQPRVELSEQLVAYPQHAAERCHHADAEAVGLGAVDDAGRFEELHADHDRPCPLGRVKIRPSCNSY